MGGLQPKQTRKKTSPKFETCCSLRFISIFVFFGFLWYFFGFSRSELRQEIPAIQKSCHSRNRSDNRRSNSRGWHDSRDHKGKSNSIQCQNCDRYDHSARNCKIRTKQELRPLSLCQAAASPNLIYVSILYKPMSLYISLLRILIQATTQPHSILLSNHQGHSEANHRRHAF